MTIHYREPTYELATGPRDAPYRWVIDVLASDEAEAERVAKEEFEELARLSNAGWVRQVVQIATTALAPEDPGIAL